MVSDRHKLITKAHQEASKRLRQQFPAEYRALLSAVYEEQGLIVRKRRSKAEVLADRLEEARRLLAENS